MLSDNQRDALSRQTLVTTDFEAQEEGEHVPLLSQRHSQIDTQLTILDSQVEFNEGLIYERDSDILQIQESIGQVNEIFRDLGGLVHEQGHMLDNIESMWGGG